MVETLRMAITRPNTASWLQSRPAAEFESFRQPLERRSIGSGVFSTSPMNRIRRYEPPSDDRNGEVAAWRRREQRNTICVPMVRPPCMRRRSACTTKDARVKLHERAGHHLHCPRFRRTSVKPVFIAAFHSCPRSSSDRTWLIEGRAGNRVKALKCGSRPAFPCLLRQNLTQLINS